MAKKTNRGSDNPYAGIEDEFEMPSGAAVAALLNEMEEERKAVVALAPKAVSAPPKTKKEFALRNQSYIEMEMMELISSAKAIRDKLEQEVKIGADNRTYEVYATLINAIGAQITSLANMSEALEKAKSNRVKNRISIRKIKKVESLEDMPGNKAIPMTSSQLLDIIQKATEQSQLNNISTDFEVLETYKEDH